MTELPFKDSEWTCTVLPQEHARVQAPTENALLRTQV
jgi:hypothetical protein